MLIKHSPKDFIVEEIPAKEWMSSGAYAVFKLTKINLNTEQAIDIITKKFHLIVESIKYSGTKDKHAHTIQYISIPNRTGISQIRINEENIKLEHVGYNDEPLSLGTLKGNKFIITLRELNPQELESLNTKRVLIAQTLSEQDFCIPNYFDDQRFSTNNYNIGLCILKKDYKNVVKYLSENNDSYSEKSKTYLDKNPNDYVGTLRFIPRKTLLMFIHAVQSYFFNVSLSKLLEDKAKKENIKHTNISYIMGDLIFYKDFSQYDKFITDTKELELIGFNTLDINKYVKQLLNELNLIPRDFIIRAIPNLSVEGTTRESIVSVKNLSIEIEKIDIESNSTNVAIIKFELPKGSYATMVIKALIE